MDNADVKRQRLALIFQYGQKAMQWSLIHDELRKIEKDLGMTAEEIMDEAMRNTDITRQHGRPVGHGVSVNEKDSDTSDK